VPHRLAELAIAGNADAEVSLATHNVGDGRTKLSLEALLVGRAAGFAGPIRLDQVVRARQASGVTREDVVTAVLHASRVVRSRDGVKRPVRIVLAFAPEQSQSSAL
jgi:hypothetical protein